MELRVRLGVLDRLDDEGAADGSSVRSHIAVVWLRVMRSLPLPTSVGVPDMGGSMKVFLRLVGVGGVKPIPLTNVLPLLEPDPSRLPDVEAGRRKFRPMPEARDRLRLPFDPVVMPETSTSLQVRTSSSAICRTKTAGSCPMSQLIRS